MIALFFFLGIIAVFVIVIKVIDWQNHRQPKNFKVIIDDKFGLNSKTDLDRFKNFLKRK